MWQGFRTIYERLHPFSSSNILSRLVDDAGSILDIGCGTGEVMKLLHKRHPSYWVGLDIDLLSLRQARKIYDDVVLADARYLPFREGSSFDIVTCLELIEHIPKREGIVLLRNLSALASKKLVVSTPSYFFELPAPNNGAGYGHVSFYSPKELKELGFETHGLRVRAFAGKNSLIIGIVRAVLAPLTYFFPSMAACTIGVKQTERNRSAPGRP